MEGVEMVWRRLGGQLVGQGPQERNKVGERMLWGMAPGTLPLGDAVG